MGGICRCARAPTTTKGVLTRSVRDWARPPASSCTRLAASCRCGCGCGGRQTLPAGLLPTACTSAAAAADTDGSGNLTTGCLGAAMASRAARRKRPPPLATARAAARAAAAAAATVAATAAAFEALLHASAAASAHAASASASDCRHPTPTQTRPPTHAAESLFFFKKTARKRTRPRLRRVREKGNTRRCQESANTRN